MPGHRIIGGDPDSLTWFQGANTPISEKLDCGCRVRTPNTIGATSTVLAGDSPQGFVVGRSWRGLASPDGSSPVLGGHLPPMIHQGLSNTSSCNTDRNQGGFTMSFAALGTVLAGVSWTNENSESYWQAFPDSRIEWDLVHTIEVLVPFDWTISPSVNWTEGGTCEWCGRSVRVCPGHRPDGVLVTRTDIPEGMAVVVNGFRMTTNGHVHPQSFADAFAVSR